MVIEIRVFSLEGILIDAQGQPLRNHPIEIRPVGGETRLKLSTDGAGRFRFIGLLAGEYRLTHPVPDDGGRTLLFRGGESVRAGVQDVRVTAVKGATISGFVRTADGQPVAGANVSARIGDGRLRVRVASDGSFELTGLADGAVVTIIVWAKGYATITKEGVRAGARDLSIALRPERGYGRRLRAPPPPGTTEITKRSRPWAAP